tara:strand:+ start:537 stop:779 length:243 start_codon:yes stop_codon:yes gene_type:complete
VTEWLPNHARGQLRTKQTAAATGNQSSARACTDNRQDLEMEVVVANSSFATSKIYQNFNKLAENTQIHSWDISQNTAKQS